MRSRFQRSSVPATLALAASGLIAFPAQAQDCAFQFNPDAPGVLGGIEFGKAVGMGADFALLGAPRDNLAGSSAGAVWSYTRVGTQFVQTARLVAPDAALQDQASFGASLAVDGARALVGAPSDDAAGADAGAVYVLERTPSGWEFVQKLVSPDGEAGARFGHAVDLDAGHALIGSAFSDVGAVDGGAAFVFEEFAGQFTWSATLSPSGTGVEDGVARSLALCGSLIVLGAPLDDVTGEDDGSAWIFEQQGGPSGGPWIEVAQVLSSSFDPLDHFGIFVHTDGVRVAAGSNGDVEGTRRVGSVSIYERDGAAGWSEAAYLRPPGMPHGARFGESLALDAGELFVGAPGGNGNKGVVHLFREETSGWQEVGRLLPSGVGTGFASALSVERGSVLVGAPLYRQLAEQSGLGFAFMGAGGPLVHCVSTANSTGNVAAMALSGPPSLGAMPLALQVAPVPADGFGLLVDAGEAASFPFANGVRCVAGPTLRRLSATRAQGELLELELAPGAYSAGETRYFQAWFRDPAAGGARANTSSGLRVTFCP